MKKSKTLKGFTLVECVVAMAILGIASLVMAQIYGTVARINRENHIINESLSQTVEKAEKKLSSTGIASEIIHIDGDPADGGAATQITFEKDGAHASGTASEYTIPKEDTVVYVYSPRYTANSTTTIYATTSSDPIGLRYKYFVYEP